MLTIVRIGYILFFATASTLLADGLKEQRVWKSSDGREITASVLELDADAETVKLKRNDGYIFTIAFDRFAEADAKRLQIAAEKQAETQETPDDSEPEPQEPEELPDKVELDDVPMIRQKGAFCVPASAAMVANFHEIETDQDQIAFLSSGNSFNHQGTNPQDMLLAMQKLGFDGKTLYWKNAEDFYKTVLPVIRKSLVNDGPIYISFAPGVFGNSGHGCIIIGYNHRKEELIFHNPWGNVFEKDYEDVATQGRGIVLIFAPDPAPIADEAFIEKIKTYVPKFDGDISGIPQALGRNKQKHKLVWCSRRDARDDKRFAADTARDDGRKILDLAFHRNPAVLLPANNKKGETQKYLFVTRPPEGGARLLVREITAGGWSDPELVTLGSLTRAWPTRIESAPEKFIWELPMIELHPDD